MNSAAGDRVVVVGGGVIGAMCAWYLVEAGFKVSIVDKDKFGAACSHGNCGYVAPSHVLPLTRPGTIGSTLRSMMKSNSPFAVKPRFSADAISWFWKFARRCNEKHMLESAVGLHELLQSSASLYKDLIESESIDCEWREAGILFVYDDQKHFDEFAKVNQLIEDRFGLAARPYDERALLEKEPAIKPGVACGAWHYEMDCHLRPDKLMTALKQKLAERGVEFYENWELKSFVSENGSARAVSNGQQEIQADHFVAALGAWTPFINQHLGCRIPIQPGKGYSITMPTPQKMPRFPIIFEDCHVAVTPMDSKYRIGSTMEFVGYDSSINPKRLGLLKSAAEKYLLDPHSEPIEEKWFGWRPMTWDGKPVMDRSPAMKNVWVAAGHNMIGLSTATASGKFMAELISGEKPHLDSAHFSIARLGK